MSERRTDIYLNRQQAYQQRHRELGLCIDCPCPIWLDSKLCRRHLLRRRWYNRKVNECQPRWKSGRGRPAMRIRRIA